MKEEKINKLRPLFRKLEEAYTAIAQVLDGASVAEPDIEVGPEKNATETRQVFTDGMACCGSRGKRHKKGCENAKGKHQNIQEQRSKKYRCMECENQFDDDREYLDVCCPCGASRVIQLPA